jgi:uncharacterized protein YecE (DUF72 family)
VARVLVGTSGWTYPSWRGAFYPEDLPGNQYLKFYARKFPTTEVNYSFYHLPRPQTYAKWAGQVPEPFVFALKASRLITHTKRLVEVTEAWKTFVGNALALGPRLGPILLQFPASFRRETKRLDEFLKAACGGGPERLRLVFEFRHESWFTDDICRVLERHGAALCIADSPNYPRHDILTADFAYFRFHGREHLFASSYSKAELTAEARKMKQHVTGGLDVYAYFNNTAGLAAVRNAQTLKALVKA